VVNSAIEVGAFQSWMSPGSSHHFIVFEESPGKADGSVASCVFGSGNWRYATSVSGQIIELKMPDGVGLSVAAGQVFDMNMHFVNPGSTAVTPALKLNVIFAQNVTNHAKAMYSFNTGINVPAGSAAAPGKQTVNGSCSAPAGTKFFALTTHTHKHAVLAEINLVRGGQTTNIVHTTNWEAPDVGLWGAPNFLTIQSGDSLTYSCSYTNTTPSAVLVGETAASNEMCMAIGYYFPSTNTVTCL
jgi:hypothetical protein